MKMKMLKIRKNKMFPQPNPWLPVGLMDRWIDDWKEWSGVVVWTNGWMDGWMGNGCPVVVGAEAVSRTILRCPGERSQLLQDSDRAQSREREDGRPNVNLIHIRILLPPSLPPSSLTMYPIPTHRNQQSVQLCLNQSFQRNHHWKYIDRPTTVWFPSLFLLFLSFGCGPIRRTKSTKIIHEPGRGKKKVLFSYSEVEEIRGKKKEVNQGKKKIIPILFSWSMNQSIDQSKHPSIHFSIPSLLCFYLVKERMNEWLMGWMDGWMNWLIESFIPSSERERGSIDGC